MSALTTSFPVHIAVLAGGRSSRMGCDKRFLEVDGETALNRVLRISETWISRGSGRVFLCGSVEGYPSLHDRAPGIGPLAGVASAVFALRKSGNTGDLWLLLLPVDMPRLSHMLLDDLVGALVSLSGQDRRLGAIQFEGFELPCLLRVTAEFESVLDLHLQDPSPSRRSLRRLLDALQARRVLLRSEFMNAMENMNTPEDLARIRRMS